MTPPDEYVVETARRALPTRASSIDRFYPDLSLLADLLTLFALALSTRFVVGIVDTATGLFVLSLALLVARTQESAERLHIAALDDVGRLFRAVVFAYAATALLTTLVPGLGDLRDSRSLLPVAALSVPALLLGRSLYYSTRRAAGRRGVKTRTLVVGAGEVAQELISVLNEDPAYGLHVVGAVDDSARFDGDSLGTRLLGGLSDLSRLVGAYNCDAVIVAFSRSNDAAALRAVREALSLNVDAWVVPRFFEMGGDMTGFDHIGSVPVVKIHARPEARRGRLAKRVLDILLSAFGIAVGWPLMLLIAVAVKLDSPGPALFRQERFGKNRRPFWMLKFRTMVVMPPDQEDRRWETDEDRITRVGGFLRSTSLDELPQLFNVLRGDLSLVGPRPERPRYVDSFEALYPGYSERHRVPAGVTGWAQVHGLRGETSMRHRARFDNYYIENWSLSSDVKIFLLTARSLLKRHRPFAEERSSREDDPKRPATDA